MSSHHPILGRAKAYVKLAAIAVLIIYFSPSSWMMRFAQILQSLVMVWRISYRTSGVVVVGEGQHHRGTHRDGM